MQQLLCTFVTYCHKDTAGFCASWRAWVLFLNPFRISWFSSPRQMHGWEEWIQAIIQFVRTTFGLSPILLQHLVPSRTEELDRIQLYFKKVRTAVEGVRILQALKIAKLAKVLLVLLNLIPDKSLNRSVSEAAEKEVSRERARVDVDVPWITRETLGFENTETRLHVETVETRLPTIDLETMRLWCDSAIA